MASPNKGGTLAKSSTTIYKVAELVASGKGSEEISVAIGVTKRKASEWMRHPEVKAAVGKLLKDKAQMHVAKALNVLFELLDDKNPWVRMTAARTLIEKQGIYALPAAEDADNVIRIEGMPTLGVPDGTVGREDIFSLSDSEEMDVEATIT